MATRIRKLFGSTKWVVEVRQGCCNWVYIDPQTLEAHMPIMPYENWFELNDEESAKLVQQRFILKRK